ncbi:MAG: AsmA-like C-terminal domain-containing protein [Deltaproteobacteria bacterium]|nr:AsmA-like C-terminal domain-containing protein [Candidatus Tharpella sp.]
MRRWGKRFFPRIGALLLLLFFLLIISLPNLIDLENFRPLLLEYLHSRFSGEVVVGKLSLTFRHGPGVRVDGVRLSGKNEVPQISVSTAIVSFDFFHLFERHLQLSRVTLIQPRVSLRINAGISPMADFLRPQVITKPQMEQKSGQNLLSQFVGGKNGEISPKKSAGLLKSWYFDADVSQTQVEIIDGSVVFTDSRFTTSPVVTHLENLKLSLEGCEAETPVDFKLVARVIDEKSEGSLNIEGSLSALRWPLRPGEMFLDCQVKAGNLNGGAYFPYYQKYVPMRFIGGRVDIDSTYKGSLMGLFRSTGRIVLHQAELDYEQVFSRKLQFDRFAVDYDFRLADSYNTIETLKCAIDADGLRAKGHCLLYEARRGIDGTIEAGLDILEFDPRAISALLPWEIIPEKIKTYYQILQKGGRCTVNDAYLKGNYRQVVKLGDIDPPSGVMGGRFHADKLIFKVFDSGPLLAVGAADITLDGGLLKVTDLDFLWGALSGDAVNFSLQKLYHDPQIKLAGHFNLAFEPLQSFLQSFFKTGAESFQDDSLPVHFSGGSLQGDMALKGSLLRPSGLVWGGTFKGRELAFGLAGISPAVTKGEGSFVLANDRFIIEKAACTVASLPLTLRGSLPGLAAWLDENDERKLELKLVVSCPEVAPEQLDLLLGDNFSIAGVKAGSSPVEFTLNADLKHFSDFDLQGTMHLDWRDIELPSINLSLDRLNCSAKFDERSVNVDRLLIERGDSDITFKGSFFLDEEGTGYTLDGNVVGEHLFIDDFLPFGTGAEGKTSFVAKTLKVNLDGVIKELVLPQSDGNKKNQAERKPWHYLNDFDFAFSGGLEKAVKIERCDWHWGKQRSQISLTGQLQYLTGLHGELEIMAQDFDLDLLLQQPESESDDLDNDSSSNPEEGTVKAVLLDKLATKVKADAVENFLSWRKWLSQNNLHVKAHAQCLRWQQMAIYEIECDCLLDASGVDCKKIAGHSFGGDLYAFMQWHFADDFFQCGFELEDIDFETFNDYLKNPDRGLPMWGGHGSLNLDLEWQGRSLAKWRKSLNGELDYVFYDGRLKKFTMLSNICSLLNLSQFTALHLPKFSVDKGIPYRTLSSKGIIVDGIMEVEEFALRGSALNLFGDGTISMIEDRVDFDLGAQPLQTVDKVLATIPVVGYIMTGDKKTFVVIPMKVQGPFDDVKVETQTVSGLGKKAGGMIQRFFNTPIRLLRIPGKLLGQMGSGGRSETDSKNITVGN